ncbi:hypothetical protein C8R43DRAFT_1104268 [Mycena crocata]|nr:hypothetical protein C8R43DRAFT_1104268 [Mycena crocata]
MHRSLRIRDIIELICDSLDDDTPAKTASRFAALARTCKVFQDPALNHLWRHQNTLAHILQCLPPHLWEIMVEEPGRTIVHITGTIKPKDWDRPLEYARRVRSLSLVEWVEWRILPSTNNLEVISSTLPLQYLCPNLRTLIWRSRTAALCPYIRLFLSPKVTTAHLSFPESDSSIVSLLPTLALSYPHLKSLRIEGVKSADSSLVRRTESTIAMALDRIEDLGLDTIDGVALQHLSRLSALKSLELYNPLDVGDLASFCDLRFPALRAVRLSDTTIDVATSFVTVLSDCGLESFHAETGIAASAVTMHTFYTALANHLSHTALQNLNVADEEGVFQDMEAPPENAIADYVINGRVLSTLFCFGDLRSVFLKAPLGFDLDDTTVWDVARAWPRLQDLCLETATGLSYPPSMTLRGLRAFATHCPDLDFLSITFDTSTVPPLDNSQETRLSHDALTGLGVGVAPVPDPGNIARFLSTLFPNIGYITTYNDWRWGGVDADQSDELARHSAWKQVEKMIPVLTSIRREVKRREDSQA